MTLRRTMAMIGGCALVLALTVTLAGPAAAHAGNESYLYLDVSDSELSGRVEMPLPDLRDVFDLDLDGTSDDIVAELDGATAAINAYLSSHVSVGAAGASWPLTFDDITLLDADDPFDGNYALFHFEASAPSTGVPRQLEVTFDPFFDELDDRGALLLIGNDWTGGVIDNAEEVLVRYTPSSRTQVVDLGSSSQWHNFTASIGAGVDHIRTGPDHVLFVLVLLLPSVLVFRAGWQPATSFSSALWRILKIVSMFTLAHSITFVLAGLDAIPLPPSRLVETLIAASIAAAALHNLRPIAPNREWAIAFGFGLFHGMGFATLVSGLDVGTSTQLVSLLGRNVGIEIGQAIVVLITFPALFLLRRTVFYRPLFVFGSVALAVMSAGWMIERVFEADLRFSSLIDRVIQWPRILLPLVLATAAAGAIERRERLADRLLLAAPDSVDGVPAEVPVE